MEDQLLIEPATTSRVRAALRAEPSWQFPGTVSTPHCSWFSGPGLEVARRAANGTGSWSRDAACLTAMAAVWCEGQGLRLVDVMAQLGMGPGLRCFQLAVDNRAAGVAIDARYCLDGDDRLGLLCLRTGDTPGLDGLAAARHAEQCGFPDTGARQKVHAGLYHNLRAIADPLLALLRHHRPEHLLLAGHGAGGGLALLSAALLVASGDRASLERLRGIYTFGQPPVGNAAFVAAHEPELGSRLYRHVYRWDLVARLPPRAAGYCHMGQELRVVRLDRSGLEEWRPSIRTTRPLWQHQPGLALARLAPLLRGRVPAALWALLGLPGVSLADHRPAHYLRVSRSRVAGSDRLP